MCVCVRFSFLSASFSWMRKCVMVTCCEAGRLRSSNQGPREWAEAGGQQPHVLHSLFTAGIQKNLSDSLQKNRDACERGTEPWVRCLLTGREPNSQRRMDRPRTFNECLNGGSSSKVLSKCQFGWIFLHIAPRGDIHCDSPECCKSCFAFCGHRKRSAALFV